MIIFHINIYCYNTLKAYYEGRKFIGGWGLIMTLINYIKKYIITYIINNIFDNIIVISKISYYNIYILSKKNSYFDFGNKQIFPISSSSSYEFSNGNLI